MTRQQPPQVTFGTQQSIATNGDDAQRPREGRDALPRAGELVPIDTRRTNALVIAGGVLAGTVKVVWHGV